MYFFCFDHVDELCMPAVLPKELDLRHPQKFSTGLALQGATRASQGFLCVVHVQLFLIQLSGAHPSCSAAASRPTREEMNVVSTTQQNQAFHTLSFGYDWELGLLTLGKQICSLL